jgi:hypothetical protein
MADEPKPTPDHQIAVQMDQHTSVGVYSNMMMVSHRKEEFVLDFLFVQPQRAPQGQSVANLRARIITSPQHAKRIFKAMHENIRRYEQAFGPIEETAELPTVMH